MGEGLSKSEPQSFYQQLVLINDVFPHSVNSLTFLIHLSVRRDKEYQELYEGT
jgi:hypothetical protein